MIDTFEDLRQLTGAADGWFQFFSQGQSQAVSVERLTSLLLAFDRERKRRFELESTLSDLTDYECGWSEAQKRGEG